MDAGTTGTPVSEAGLLIITWLFFAIATALTIFRLYVRRTRSRGFGWDDAFHCIAWVLLLSNDILGTTVNHLNFEVSGVTSGTTAITASFLEEQVPRFINVQFATTAIFFFNVFAVKLAFLMFYRDFFKGLRSHMIAWWCVTIFICCAFVPIIPTIVTACGSASDYFSINSCLSEEALQRTRANVISSSVLDAITDLMIMALPMRILWDLRVNRRQKLGLALAFSLGGIIVIFCSLRAAYTLSTLAPTGIYSLARADPIDLNLWSVLEASVAVIVSCLPSLRVLILGKQRRRNEDRQKQYSISHEKRASAKAASNQTGRWFRLPGATNVVDTVATGNIQDTQKTLVETELTTFSHEVIGGDDFKESREARAAGRVRPLREPRPAYFNTSARGRSWLVDARRSSPIDEESQIDMIRSLP